MREETAIETTIERYTSFINPAMTKLFRLMGLSAAECHAEGVYIFDQQGEKYLDFLGGYGVFSLGHRHPEVVRAVQAQLERMPLSGKILFNGRLAELSEKLAQFLPGLQYSFIVNSGAEAVEGALKLARIHTGRAKIIAMENSFHGKTFGALSATGREVFKAPFAPLVPGFIHVPFNDIAALKERIDADTAAVILEPVQGEGGVIVPDSGYLQAVRRLCKTWGSLLICDEVQTGFGRTGKMFAVEYDDVTPDIMVTAKALGGGVMPIGAFTARREVWDAYIEHPFIHTSTFGGNPLACAAAIATLDVLRRDYASFAVAEKGAIFIGGLKELGALHPRLVAAVRGRGLMAGVEVRDGGVGGFLIAYAIKRRILAAYTLNNPKVIRFEPPFLISREMIRQVLDVFSEGLDEAEKIF